MRAKNLIPFDKQSLNEASTKTRQKILEYIKASSAPKTKRAYNEHLNRFIDWLERNDYSFPATEWQTAEYLIEEVEGRLTEEGKPYKKATLAAWLTAISLGHLTQGYASPVESVIVQKVYQGICNLHGEPQKRAQALTRDDIIRMIDTSTGNELQDKRDRCLIVIGFTGGFRTDELIRANCNDITPVRHELADGYVIRIQRSKTDQRGIGRDVYIPISGKRLSPAKVLGEWLKCVKTGKLFTNIRKNQVLGDSISYQGVLDIIRNRAYLAGIKNYESVSGHSLRRGYVTTAYKLKFDNRAIAKQTGQSVATVNKYIDDQSLFVNNPATKLF